MKKKGFSRLALANAIAFALCSVASPLTAQTFTTLHSFNGGSDGAFPNALISSSNTLYGTASSGGSHGFGTVFKVDANGPYEPLWV